MSVTSIILILAILAIFAFTQGRLRSLVIAKNSGGVRNLHSLPFYHGMQSAIWATLPALLLLVIWLIFQTMVINAMVIDTLPGDWIPESSVERQLLLNKLQNIADGILNQYEQPEALLAASETLLRFQQIGNQIITGAVFSVASICLLVSLKQIHLKNTARHFVEKIVLILLMLCASIAVFTTVGILFSVIFESLLFFKTIPVLDFVFGLEWSPQTAIREDQAGSSGLFGAIPLFAGTLLITFIAMTIAVPVGLMSAVYLAEYANKNVRTYAKPALEILAGIPTVVYGFFAALTVAPFIRGIGENIGLSVSSESALAAGGVMGIMIIPFISSLADDVITAVPQSMRDGSLAMGATRSETILKVIFPAALPGIVGGILLAVSRAVGETMIVVMAAGMAANLTANPLEAVTTVTVQIVTLLTGDQEFDSPKTLAAFALGLMLFLFTLALNVIALKIVKKYREEYE